jgi:hypothetical protein
MFVHNVDSAFFNSYILSLFKKWIRRASERRDVSAAGVPKERTLCSRDGVNWILTACTEQSIAWEANWLSAGQGIPGILWNPKVYCRLYKNQSPVPILGDVNPIHAKRPAHFLKIRLNIILLSTSGSPQWSLSQGFSTETLYTQLLSPYVLHAPPISFFCIWSPEQYWVSSTDH